MASLPSGPISPINRESRRDLRETVLKTVWTKSPSTRAALSGAGTPDVHYGGSEQVGVPSSHETPVLIVLGEEPPPTLLHWLRDHGNGGTRIYLLVAPTWGSDQQDMELAGSRSARILVRRSPGIPFSAIYGIAGGALLWPGPTLESGAAWCLRLDQAQSDALRLHFLRLFWYHAQDEAWSSGVAKWTFSAPKDRPFDVPLSMEDSPLRLIEPYRHDPRGLEGQVQFSPNGLLPSVKCTHLGLPPSGGLHTELAKLVAAGTSVAWSPLKLPRAAWGASGGILAPSTDHWVLEVELTTPQRDALRKRIPAQPEWQFQTNATLSGFTSGDLWLADEPQPRSAKPLQTIALPDLPCDSIRRTIQAQPAIWPSADLLTLEVVYRWRNCPPVPPKGAENDPLVAAWERADTQWQEGIKKLEDRLREGESILGKMQQSLSKWLGGNLLGFGQSKEQLAKGLEQCHKLRPSATTRTELIAATDKLKTLASSIQTFAGDLSKSQREGEERQQREQWENDRKRDKQHLDENKAKSEEARQNEANLAQKLAELDTTLEGARDSDWKPRRQKTQDELVKTRSALKGFDGEVTSLEKRLKEPFVFKTKDSASGPSAVAKGNKFVPQSKNDSELTLPVFPPEDLPTVGGLLIYQKQRYLAISSWEELDAGERESTRLKAILVAKE